MRLPDPSTLVFIGDSITDAGRTPPGEPSPWLPDFGLGRGYVSQVWAWLSATHPGNRIRLHNKGVSGDTVRELDARWRADVLDIRADVLCVLVGINDVWRQFDTPLRADKPVGPDDYRATLDRLLAGTRPALRQLYLASPFFLEPNRADPMRARMDAYGAIVRELAARHDAVFVDTQAAFDVVLAHTHASALAWDRIHPGPHGHMVIARAFLQAFGIAAP